MAPIVTVTQLDHLVLTVTDIRTTIAWYTQTLGMSHVSFHSPKDPRVQRHALTFGGQKINLHRAGAEFEPRAERATPGSADLCFLTETPVDEMLVALKRERIEVLEGGVVVDRIGARGMLRSVYVRDPDGNLVEISNEMDPNEAAA
ncbi:biphenyl-2,3-diol 1,2-dioxygenase, variant [Trichodelitschia bisporula]|uniref:Biphenyl-2,3-diol 1,2-dioxygenase, variant n=1 Tax=Trichodelitschia bisporula TaxID=703511 RepID=A0A6G1I2I5_9PEZI|nr:biphenyl-2,3-diol 1,2-dioxygenase, variant [Trichodelitschia bisporula]